MAFKSITKKEYNGIGSVVIDDIAIETEKLSTNINNLLEKSIETVAINHKARLQGKLDWEREIERPKYINNLQYGITVNGWDKLGDEQKEQQKILEKAGLTKSNKKKRRDIWDEEYDKGKVKKVKISNGKK